MKAWFSLFIETEEGHQPVGTAGVVTAVNELYDKNPEYVQKALLTEATDAIDRALEFYGKYRRGEVEAPLMEAPLMEAPLMDAPKEESK